LYLGYRPTLTYSDDFEDLQKTFHDILGGTRWIYKFGTPQAAGRSLPFKLDADLSGGPRVADPSISSAILTTLSVGLTYSRYDDQNESIWTITFKPAISANLYDREVSGKDRRDIRGGANVTWRWNPWRSSDSSILNGASLAVQASVARNESNISGRSFTVWDVGPSFLLTLGSVPQSIKPLRVFPRSSP
jgi:hypothetical protein